MGKQTAKLPRLRQRHSEEIQEPSFQAEKNGLWAGGIISPHFFKNYAGENVTVKGDCYRFMTTDYLLPEIDAGDLSDIWIQQDVAKSFTSHQPMDLLRKFFGEQIILRFGSVDYTLRSWNITSLDFFPVGIYKL